MNKKTVKLGLSSKHIHITKEDCDTLFGVGYELNRFKWMGRPDNLRRWKRWISSDLREP